MSTLLATRYDFISKLPVDSTLLLRGVSWDDYEELLDTIGESRGLRIWYDAGRLQIMTLSSKQEYLEAGAYQMEPASQALPLLNADVLNEFLARSQKEGQYETLLAFEKWLRSKLS
ncbi:MAG TPA: hypothetical protein VN920_03875 [Pyrinomonadaceae bacterium]|nr:hypothetical protein [Pyrinomonadaceae bacterium]